MSKPRGCFVHRATGNKKLKEQVAVELSFFNSNIQLLKEELSEMNSSVEVYQHDKWVSHWASCLSFRSLIWLLRGEGWGWGWGGVLKEFCGGVVTWSLANDRPFKPVCLERQYCLCCLSVILPLSHLRIFFSAVLLVSLCFFLPPLSSPLPPPPHTHNPLLPFSVYFTPDPPPLSTLPPYLCVCVMPLPLSLSPSVTLSLSVTLSPSVTLCAWPSSLSLPPPPPRSPSPLPHDRVPVCLSGLSVYTSLPPVSACLT